MTERIIFELESQESPELTIQNSSFVLAKAKNIWLLNVFKKGETTYFFKFQNIFVDINSSSDFLFIKWFALELRFPKFVNQLHAVVTGIFHF